MSIDLMDYPANNARGKLLCIEGADNSGKTTQVNELHTFIAAHKGADKVVVYRFPNRQTPIGGILNSYLQNKTELRPEVAHLLFSANRWECIDEILAKLRAGVTVILDRYLFSGIAYSRAKKLSLEWASASDTGLPIPDLTFHLSKFTPTSKNTEDLFKTREEWERFEVDTMFQASVDEKFEKYHPQIGCENTFNWHTIDATRSIKEIAEQIAQIYTEHKLSQNDIRLSVF